MDTDTEQPKPTWSRGMRVVFALSLGLNLLIIGAVAGAWFRAGPPMGGAGQPAAIARIIYHELPKEARRSLRQDLRQTLDRSTLRQTRIGPELQAALRADPFDAAAVRDLMDRQARALQTGQAAMRDSWLAILQDMSPEDRVAYADRLKERMKKRKKDEPKN